MRAHAFGVAVSPPSDHSCMDAMQKVSELALDGGGVFSRQVALEVGVTRHQVDGLLARGLIVAVHRGVFRLAGQEPTFLLRCRAAVLACGSGAAVDRRSAAMVHQLLAVVDDAPISIAIHTDRRVSVPGIELVRRASLQATDRTRVAGVSVTTVARTVIDCAAVCSAEVLTDILDEALRTRRTALPVVRREEALRSRRGRKGSRRLRAVLGEHEGDVRASNRFERDVSRILVTNGLPAPQRQFEVVLPSGDKRYVDLAYADELVGVEPAGFRWHNGRRQWATDLTRNNELIAVGWRLIPVTWEQRRRGPNVIVQTVRGALASAAGVRPLEDLPAQTG